jgi:hypothetical protein
VRPHSAFPSFTTDTNSFRNYKQIGLNFKLFSAEVLFNKGLSLIRLGRTEQGLADMESARRNKATDEHNVIDDAMRDRGGGYTVFSIVSTIDQPLSHCFVIINT